MLLSSRPAVHDGEVQRGTRKHGLNIPKVPPRRRLGRLPDSKVWIRLFRPRKGNDARRLPRAWRNLHGPLAILSITVGSFR
ncbi:hypothetical protein BJX68DRAFT_13151 [Aspergillus pseudodeflectus]|uniref:Uncharacterized protein n=1 Tax=Aspergillus pseudodeflectus TaxID=176178 RepID=A0ABR4LBF5_9EURO